MDTHPDPSGPRSIVVGADGSDAADRAVRWAAQEAVATQAALRIVNVWSVPAMAYTSMVGTPYLDPADLAAGADQLLGRAKALAADAVGDRALTIETLAVEGLATEQLLLASESAALLVLGTRGRGGFASLVLGSVATTCVHHSQVPVAVVGLEATPPGSGPIVVGVDDSAGGRTALRWAVEDAGRAGATVRAVHGWELLLAQNDAFVLSPPWDPDLAAAAQAGLERIVSEEVATLPAGPRPPIDVVAVSCAAPEALLREAKGAALLVVGSRGLGGFKGLLLGSVSQQCLHHSPCPIVIVPPRP